MTEAAVYTTKPFMSGRSQAVRIPKEFRIDDTEVVVNKVGHSIVITPCHLVEGLFFDGINMLSQDFLVEGRPEETGNKEADI